MVNCSDERLGGSCRAKGHRARRWTAVTLAVAGAVISLGAATERDTRPALLRQGDLFLDVQDPSALRAFEQAGYGFGSLFGARGAARQAGLARDPAFAFIAKTLTEDVRVLAAEMEREGVALTTAPTDYVGRVIDMDWLRSPFAEFRLAAIVNRMDRRDFSERPETSCGEVRLVYRLAYRFGEARLPYLGTRRTERASRLPFSINAVFDLPPAVGGCRAEAQSFVAPRDLDRSAFVRWLATGPLARERLTLRQIEVNAQVVRIPSELEPGFGGQAVYLMRVFGVEGTDGGRPRVAVRRLENTPDAARLRGDAALAKDLLAYVAENRSAIATGAYRLPDRFLAEKALSYSTFGSSRSAHRPFASSFDGAIDRALLARLDGGTCTGCHQSNATAGFHMIGLDEDDAFPLNRVLLGASPHFYADRERRRAVLAALAAGRTPPRFRPPPTAPAADWSDPGRPAYRASGLGMPCGDEAEGSGPWACEGGLACRTVAARSDGLLHTRQCLPPEPSGLAGLSCWTGLPRSAGPLGQPTRHAEARQKAAARITPARPCRPGQTEREPSPGRASALPPTWSFSFASTGTRTRSPAPEGRRSAQRKSPGGAGASSRPIRFVRATRCGCRRARG